MLTESLQPFRRGSFSLSMSTYTSPVQDVLIGKTPGKECRPGQIRRSPKFSPTVGAFSRINGVSEPTPLLGFKSSSEDSSSFPLASNSWTVALILQDADTSSDLSASLFTA